MFEKSEVNIGDRFTKVGNFSMPTWVVAHISTRELAPPHAQLEKEGMARDRITVSLPALADTTLYKRVPSRT